jgi:branched-chain amino acid transport system permease protein
MTEWINTLIQGALLGGLYALFAAGLSLSFGVMRIINIAHGDLAVMSAFAAFAILGVLPIHPLLTLVLVVPFMAAFGYVLQRLVLNRTLGKDPLPPLLVTFGLSIIIQNLLLQIFSANSRSLPIGTLATDSIGLGAGISVGVLPVMVMATAVIGLAGLQWFLSSTALGRAFRATSDDPATAQLMGINHRHIYGLAMALGFALVAVAGVYLGARANLGPGDGPARLLYGFESVIIGGLGSPWGTLVGGVLLGVSQGIGYKFDPGWGILAGHLMFLVVLIFKPNGFFAKTRG